MKLQQLVLAAALAFAGSAFAGTTHATVTKQKADGTTVTRHVVVKKNHHRAAKHVVIHRTPVRHHSHRVATTHRKTVVVHRNG